MTGGLIAFILAAIVIVVACCKSKKKRRHKKSKTTITSTYPGFLTSVYRQMPYPKVNSWFAKVMFSQVSVRPPGGGGLGLCPGGSLSGGFLSGRPSWTERHTPDREKPSGQRHPLDRDPPVRNGWAVSILLECILVSNAHMYPLSFSSNTNIYKIFLLF